MRIVRELIDAFLHLLEKMPAWFPMTTIFLVVLWRYEIHHDPFLQRVVDTVLGGLLGIFIGRRVSPNNTGQPSYTQSITKEMTVSGDRPDLSEIAHINDESDLPQGDEPKQDG